MRIGFNLPWGVYGHTFGRDFRNPRWTPLLARPGGRALICRRLDRLVELARVGVVRFWVFTNLEGMALQRGADGVVLGAGRLPSETAEQIDWFCRAATERGLSLYPCLGQIRGDEYQDVPRYVLPWLFQPGHLPYAWQGLRADGLAGLLEGAVRPLCRILSGYRHALFGIDLYNEIEALVLHRDANPRGLIDWGSATSLLAGLAAAVRAELPGVPVAAGSGWQGFRNTARYAALGLDWLDVHAYAKRPGGLRLPKAARFDRPVVLGEFGAHLCADAPMRWMQSASVQLLHAAERGYHAAFFWADDERFLLDSPQLRQLGRIAEAARRAPGTRRRRGPILRPGREQPWRRLRPGSGPRWP